MPLIPIRRGRFRPHFGNQGDIPGYFQEGSNPAVLRAFPEPGFGNRARNGLIYPQGTDTRENK